MKLTNHFSAIGDTARSVELKIRRRLTLRTLRRTTARKTVNHLGTTYDALPISIGC